MRSQLDSFADLSGSQLYLNTDSSTITGIATLDQAGPRDIAVLHNNKYRHQLPDTKAHTVIIHEKHKDLAPKHINWLVNPNPYKAFALIAQALYEKARNSNSHSSTSSIHPTAKIGRHCFIGDYVVIGENVELGDDCMIHSHVTINHSTIGQGCTIHPGARIGQTGFGFASDKDGHYSIPHIGGVTIGDHVSIGANTCIDRGTMEDTVIGDHCRIDNLVQIGHNVKMGRGCVIVAQVAIAGSVILGNFVTLGGQAGVAGHLRIGSYSTALAQTGISNHVSDHAKVCGSPAVPYKQWIKRQLSIKKLLQSKPNNK